PSLWPSTSWSTSPVLTAGVELPAWYASVGTTHDATFSSWSPVDPMLAKLKRPTHDDSSYRARWARRPLSDGHSRRCRSRGRAPVPSHRLLERGLGRGVFEVLRHESNRAAHCPAVCRHVVIVSGLARARERRAGQYLHRPECHPATNRLETTDGHR